ncbi:MAG TPA: hypothetical protein VNZ64_09805 [Candidatus Acidoferrum sp.]|jgi:hypothetical protein|nr:hypothetical protein [Candidatus Acidoferrum sp.]
MKIKTLLSTALIGFGVISQASAINTIYITGSTAFRSQVFNTLSASGVVFDAPGPDAVATYGASSASGGTWMLFHGMVSSVETYVDCVWSGSEAGIAATCGTTIDNGGVPLAGAPVFFLVPNTVTNPNGNNSANPGSSKTNSVSTPPDLAMADTSQAVSLTQTPVLHDFGVVGIVPFVYCKNTNSSPTAQWLHLTNCTHYQMRVCLGVPQEAGFFTGSSADTNMYVYPVGRNKGSGTRVNFLADNAYGITTDVQQFSIGGNPFTNGTAATLGDELNNGYESGGDVSKALSVNGSCQTPDPLQQLPDGTTPSGYIAIGYLGIGDATKNSLGTNLWLTLNGVFESDGAVEEGTYSYWGHEHLLGKNGISLTSPEGKLGTALFSGIPGQLGGSVTTAHSTGIKTTFMHCDKGSDIAIPTRL